MDVALKAFADVGGKFKYSKEENKTYEDLRDNALNTIIVDTKNVGTLSFKEAERKAEFLHIKGVISARRHVDNHEMGNKSDPNLEVKEFMLKIYEDTQVESVKDKVKEKVVKGKETKLNKMLELCSSKAWVGKNKDEMLTSFVEIASQNRSGKPALSKEDISNNKTTKTMQKVIKMLNDPVTPSVIKQDFAKIAGLDVKKLAPNYKFKTADFKEIINANREVQNAKTNQIDAVEKQITYKQKISHKLANAKDKVKTKLNNVKEVTVKKTAKQFQSNSNARSQLKKMKLVLDELKTKLNEKTKARKNNQVHSSKASIKQNNQSPSR